MCLTYQLYHLFNSNEQGQQLPQIFTTHAHYVTYLFVGIEDYLEPFQAVFRGSPLKTECDEEKKQKDGPSQTDSRQKDRQTNTQTQTNTHTRWQECRFDLVSFFPLLVDLSNHVP